MQQAVEQLEIEIKDLLRQALERLDKAVQPAEVEEVRLDYLGRKGALSFYLSHLREERTQEEKARIGQSINAFKQQIEEALHRKQNDLSPKSLAEKSSLDLTLPGHQSTVGRLHPITQTIHEIVHLFRQLGFSVVDGPELETESNNFDALNIPAEHPSRDSFDTFYLKIPAAENGPETSSLLRTHTSPVQIRFMKHQKPPFQIVVPGRVFRRDAVDASHCFQFHQVEGLAVAPGLTFGDLKGTLSAWARGMFGENAKLRFRPHYFPFTEPSAEGDLGCIFCSSKGCRVCGQKGWLEILGCGMVHPNVFQEVGYLQSAVGFAFGMGVERIAMLKYGIDDIRLFFENDLRFLQRFP